MSKPVIVITVGRHNLQTPRREVQAVWTGCNIAYVECVLRSGGAPLLLPCPADKETVRAALEVAHGLLLPGGGDVVSLAYGQEPHPMSRYQDPQRDEMEFEAARLAVEAGLPILGICRGIQVLSVAFGGSLVQDISCEIPDAVKHYSAEIAPTLLHTVDVESDSLLARVLGSTSLAVNSWHHQSVKDPGKGLRVNCRARDGVVEGIESSEGKPILAVQCHPEEVAASYAVFQSLFDWLVGEAGGRVGRVEGVGRGVDS